MQKIRKNKCTVPEKVVKLTDEQINRRQIDRHTDRQTTVILWGSNPQPVSS